MKILVFTEFYLPGFKGGGPIKTIANLVQATADEVSYLIITTNRDLGDYTPYNKIQTNAWSETETASIFYSSPDILGRFKYAIQLALKQYDIIYLNSFFSPFFAIFPLIIGTILKKKIVLGPRGEFSSGALALKRMKKTVFLKFFGLLNLQKGVTFQASSPFEAADIKRTLGDHVDVFIAEDIGSFEAPKKIPKKNPRNLRLVFLSRISPIKNLLQALSTLSTVSVPVLYDIYGPIEDTDYWLQCEKIIDSLPKNITARHMGELRPADVVQTLSQYDLFFLPTKGENYGHVIAEALCAGLPVLISDTTPWRDLQAIGIGWDIPLDEESLFVQAIERVSKMSADEYRKFRENVLAWARIKFAQPEVIEKNKAMFRYALEKK